MRAVYSILLLLCVCSCSSIQALLGGNSVMQPVPYVQAVPDSATTPDAPINGWRAQRSSPTEIIWLPPLVQPTPSWVKLKNVGNSKNSYNTDNSQKKSNSTKAKGEAIIGNDNAPVKAKKQAVVGDGNTVEQEEAGRPGWVWLPVVLLVVIGLWLWWKVKF